MSTISENLQIIADSTAAIKQAIIDKGGDVSGGITTWANAISGISGGESGDSTEEEIIFTGTISQTSTDTSVTFQIDGSLSKRPINMNPYQMYLTAGLIGGMGSATFQTQSLSVTINNLSFTFSAPTGPVLSGSQAPDYKPVLFVIGKDVNDDNITRLAPVKIIELTN